MSSSEAPAAGEGEGAFGRPQAGALDAAERGFAPERAGVRKSASERLPCPGAPITAGVPDGEADNTPAWALPGDRPATALPPTSTRLASCRCTRPLRPSTRDGCDYRHTRQIYSSNADRPPSPLPQLAPDSRQLAYPTCCWMSLKLCVAGEGLLRSRGALPPHGSGPAGSGSGIIIGGEDRASLSRSPRRNMDSPPVRGALRRRPPLPLGISSSPVISSLPARTVAALAPRPLAAAAAGGAGSA